MNNEKYMIRKRPKHVPAYFRNNSENCKAWRIVNDVVVDEDHYDDGAVIEDD